ncbi:2'-5' RNA ligase family protein [Nocardia cyriacigeorgica]|uniref:2'-5' RNA ligase family protein n=1 Tax=Nocardia cyriacigeorgica TaxID=135487 RepID=UPI001893A3DA|nr:2'-5' RNA ligase family protein [Nocardia cyriacigeorgica]MBF6345550.1 2'-5' RNA ligase family protein [Nocardia cyriacigeorgica]
MRELRLRDGQQGPLGHYWFLTFEHAPALHTATAECQRGLDANHFAATPINGLHLTLDRIARAGESTPEQLARIAAAAEHACAEQKPFVLTFERLVNIRAAIGFLVTPDERIRELHDALRTATTSELPKAPVKDTLAALHVTVAYPIYEGLAAEAIAAVDANEHRIGHIEVTVSDVAMVALERRGHGYQWETTARIPLIGAQCPRSTDTARTQPPQHTVPDGPTPRKSWRRIR